MKQTGCVFAVLIVLAGLTGCSSESRKLTLHEPGVYKGTKDPLLNQPAKQELIDRLKLVQTDR